MNCFFSTGCFLQQDLKEIVFVAIDHGLDIELSSSVAHAPDIVDSICKAKGQVRFLVHNYFPPPFEPFVLNLASTEPVSHRKSVNLCKQAIDLCAELGTPFYSVHAGFAFHLTPSMLGDPEAQRHIRRELLIPREKAYDIFISTIKDIAGYANAKGVKLLVENNVETTENVGHNGQSPLFLADVEDITRFFADIDDPRIGLLLDTGHAKVSAKTRGGRPEQFLEDLSPFIRAFHLSDNDGCRDTNQSFDGRVWFAPFLKEFASLPMVIEVYRMPLENMLKQRQSLEQLLADV